MSTNSPAFVITVSGISGSGKSSTVRAIAERPGNAACFYFDDYGEAMQQPGDGLQWIAEGANLKAFTLPQFGRDIKKLRQGETVVTPVGRRVESASFLVIEEPFGGGREDMAGLVDFSVCIEAPMEVALARRLLDVVERWEGEAAPRLQWIGNYLNTYLFEGMREVYAAINERVRENSNLILDGTLPVEQNARWVAEAVLQKQVQREKQ